MCICPQNGVILVLSNEYLIVRSLEQIDDRLTEFHSVSQPCARRLNQVGMAVAYRAEKRKEKGQFYSSCSDLSLEESNI